MKGTISPEEVRGIAAKISSQNEQLKAALDATKSKIDSLMGSWQGEAANATKSAYDAFATKYFASYQAMLQQYVDFLNKAVAQGWTEGEKTNVSLGQKLTM